MDAGRIKALTCLPADASFLISVPPMNPVPPVIAIVPAIN
jgi:hypothetical protein